MRVRISLSLALLLGPALTFAFDYPFRTTNLTRRVEDIALPPGFQRVPVASGSFGDYMRHAPVLPAGTPVRLHDESIVLEASSVVAVLDMPLLNVDQQCADSALRYWFEFLREVGRDQDIRAKLASGKAVSLQEWNRSRRRGQTDDETYRSFLAHCMAYLNSASLNRDLAAVESGDLQPGDLVVQPNPRGGVGHLSIVFDVAESARGERLYLVGYGFMPAQDVHIPRPAEGRGRGDWFTLEGFQAQHLNLGATYTFRRFER